MVSFFFPYLTVRPRSNKKRDEYSRNYRTYYRRSSSPQKKTSKHRPRHCVHVLYAICLLILLFKLAGRPLFNWRRATAPNNASGGPTAVKLKKKLVEYEVAETASQYDRAHLPVEAGMRPPQFGAQNGAEMSAQEAVRVLDHALLGNDDELDVVEEVPKGVVRRRYSGRRDVVRGGVHAFRRILEGEKGIRTCYHSSVTGDALCVHVPFCVRHNSIVYMGGRLRCAPYSNKQGKLGTLSMGRCVELERDVEAVGEIEQVEHKEDAWLESLERGGNVLWFEGDSILVRMGPRCKSVMHFADRIFMLHHVLQHPERYGMGAVSNVVIAADEDVAKKIRYSKSWHHGLLAAIVYPNRITYSRRTITDLVTSMPGNPGEIRVYVPSGGVWDIAKGRLVPCFRRAALPGSVRSQFFLSEDVYPGVVDQLASTSLTKYYDADVLRTQLFESLGHDGPPRIKKEILYLHRASTRSFSADGLDLFESTIRRIAKRAGFGYRLLDVAGMTFPQQIEAVASAGIVVGIHGTQMLNVLFLPSGASVLEIFPYRFTSKLFEGGSGAGLHYAQHQILHGEDYEEVNKYRGVNDCLRVSSACRIFYQSDRRKLDFDNLDAAAVGNLLEKAIAHVEQSL